MDKRLERILPRVQKPARYTGGEYNAVMKNKDEVEVRYAFCFPDTYEIGMSHLGMKILYSLVNAREDAWCERVFAPWTDMEEVMRENNIPLYGLESGDAIKDFDILGFTLQYELSFTGILNMLALAGGPLRAADRTEQHPLVVAGGPCVYNAEPMADFFDLFNIGEGEEMLPRIVRLYITMKEEGSYTKAAFLRRAAATIQGVYVPSLYDVEYNEDGTIKSYKPNAEGVPTSVKKRIVADLDTMYFPEAVVMPYLETVQDRIMLEVFRGCIRGCRFCQAGIVYRPARERGLEFLKEKARKIRASSNFFL